MFSVFNNDGSILGDDGWSNSLTDNYISQHPVLPSPILANGTLGVLGIIRSGPVHGNGLGVDSTKVLVESDVETFHPLSLRFGLDDNIADSSEIMNVHTTQDVTFDMKRAVLHVTQTIDTPELNDVNRPSERICTCTHSIRVLRHMPYFILHSVTVDVPVERQGTTITIEHLLRAPSRSDIASFDTSLMGGTLIGSANRVPPTHILSGMQKSNYDKVAQVKCASAYIFNDASIATFTGDVKSNHRGIGGTRIEIASAPPSFTIHILSCLETITPRDLLLGSFIRHGMGRNDDGVSNLISKHELSWKELWFSRIDIQPKPDLDMQAQEVFDRTMYIVRHAMYVMHATNCNVDFTGSMQYAREVHIRPLFNIFRTDASFAHGRLKGSLQEATRRARQLGLDGAYFDMCWGCVGRSLTDHGSGYAVPHISQVRSIYNLGLGLHGSTLIAVNIWDYFRVTLNRIWLREEGYPVLADIADMICDVAQAYDKQTVFPFYTKYQIHGTTGLFDDTKTVTDPILTTMSAHVALTAAIEAAKQLDETSQGRWDEVRNGLSVSYLKDVSIESKGVSINILAQNSIETNVPGDTPSTIKDLFEMLHPLNAPSLNRTIFRSETDASLALAGVMDFWVPRRAVDSDAYIYALPLDEARIRRRRLATESIAIMNSSCRLAQTHDPSRITTFSEYFADVANKHVNIWGSINLVMSPTELNHADEDLSASMLLAIGYGMANININTVVSDTSLYSSEVEISVASSSILPPTWMRLIIKGVGKTRRDYSVWNRIMFSNGTNANSTNYTPWSVDNISMW